MNRYIVSPHAQGTDGWFQDRLGKVTGSTVAAVFAKARGKADEAKTRQDLLIRLTLERITGVVTPPSTKETRAIAWGKEQEPHSRMAYEMARGIDIHESGFVYLPNMAAGCSVDGFLVDAGKKGIWESKSPDTRTHYTYLKAGVVPAEYRPQVVHNLWVTGAEFCDFQSFDPRMPVPLQKFIVRLERDEAEIKAHATAVRQFLLELDAEEHEMRVLMARA